MSKSLEHVPSVTPFFYLKIKGTIPAMEKTRKNEFIEWIVEGQSAKINKSLLSQYTEFVRAMPDAEYPKIVKSVNEFLKIKEAQKIIDVVYFSKNLGFWQGMLRLVIITMIPALIGCVYLGLKYNYWYFSIILPWIFFFGNTNAKQIHYNNMLYAVSLLYADMKKAERAEAKITGG